METEPINSEWTEFVSFLAENFNAADISEINLYDKDYSKLLTYILYRNLPDDTYLLSAGDRCHLP